MKGYVYILEVKDIMLPVCKIGMTTRTPAARLNDINNSATGDFLWEVTHEYYVNDCAAFEKLIHQKLAPLRQKRREFFNLASDHAHTAVMSILKKVDDIVQLAPPAAEIVRPHDKAQKRKRIPTFTRNDEQYAHWLDAFNEYFNIIGQPFGQLNKPTFGISDGVVGVQWNLAIDTSNNTIELGVNLEGTQKMGGMLITDFLCARPSIISLQDLYTGQQGINVTVYREAWQVASRPAIQEKYIGGNRFNLHELTTSTWASIIDEALTCLDEENGYRKRKRKQWVTLEKSGVRKQYDIAPHLLITVTLDNALEPIDAMKQAATLLQPARKWVLDAIAS